MRDRNIWSKKWDPIDRGDHYEIPLTQEKFALIDKEDLPLILPYGWMYSNNGHAICHPHYGKNKRMILMHRLILENPPYAIDHINRNGVDNRKTNLRQASKSENGMNRIKPSSNTSGYKGVSYSKVMKKWQADVMVNYKHHHLGYFDSPKEASKAYEKGAAELHGEFYYRKQT